MTAMTAAECARLGILATLPTTEKRLEQYAEQLLREPTKEAPNAPAT